MSNTQRLENLLHYTRSEASLSASRWQLSPAKKPRIAVCATPKSGSTWAANVLSKGLGVRARRLCYTYSSNEHELYVPALLDTVDIGLVSQLHMRATPHNVTLMQDFNIAAVVLTRNIFDAVASFARDLRVKLNMDSANPGQYGYSFVWLTEDMTAWSEEQLIDYSIDYYVPWYMNFLRSWDAYRLILKAFTLRYEVLKKAPNQQFQSIYTHFYRGPVVDFAALSKQRFGDNAAMSQTASEIGAGYAQLDAGRKARLSNAFRPSDSEWVRSHLEVRV